MTVEEILTNIKTKLTTNLTNINAKLTAKGQTAANTLSEVPAKIEAIEAGSSTPAVDLLVVTATASDVLSPKKFVDANGVEQAGTIATKTESNRSISGATVSFPAGYYANTHKGTVETGTLGDPNYSYIDRGVYVKSNVTKAGYISAGASNTGISLTDDNIVPENIKSGVSIFGVNGEMEQGIFPEYTSYTDVVDIDPGTSYGLSAGTYLPNGLTVYANDVIAVNPSGGPGDDIYADCDDAWNLTFDVDTTNMVGFAIIANGAVDVDGSKYRIAAMVCHVPAQSGDDISILESDGYEIELITSDPENTTRVMKNFIYTGDMIQVHVYSDSIHFEIHDDSVIRFSGAGDTYQLTPYYSIYP